MIKLDLCKYTTVKLCDEIGINKRFEFLFAELCALKLNQDSYILPIASDTELGGIKVGDGLTINSEGVLSVLSTSGRFGIEDNEGSQNRLVDMQGFNFEIFSQDVDSYSNWFMDDESISLTSFDGTSQGAFDILPTGVRLFSGIGSNINQFYVNNDGIFSVQTDGVFNYTTRFPIGEGVLPVSINNISSDIYGRVTLPISQPSNGIVSGGIITWLSEYNYNISPAVYIINGTTYFSQSTNISLTPSDSVLDRIDTVVFTTFGQVEVLEGTPSVTPAAPSVDFSTQLFGTVILIGANTTQPSVSQEIIYKENLEWETVPSSATINPDYTSSIISGTKSIFFNNTLNLDSLDLRRSSFSPSVYNSLSFKIKLLSPLSSDKRINILFYRNSTVVSNVVSLSDGFYGFNSTNLGIQTIALPLSLFAINGNITRIRFQSISSSGTIGALIDDIILQDSIINVLNSNQSIPSLQEVTDIGNSTNNSIYINNTLNVLDLIYSSGYVCQSDIFNIYNYNPEVAISFQAFSSENSATFDFSSLSSPRIWNLPDQNGEIAIFEQVTPTSGIIKSNNVPATLIAPSFSSGHNEFYVTTPDGVTGTLIYYYNLDQSKTINFNAGLVSTSRTYDYPDSDGKIVVDSDLTLELATVISNKTPFGLVVTDGVNDLIILEPNSGSPKITVQSSTSLVLIESDKYSLTKSDGSGFEITSTANSSQVANINVLGHNGTLQVSNSYEIDLSTESGTISFPGIYQFNLSTGTQTSDIELPDPSSFAGCEIVIINIDSSSPLSISGFFVPSNQGELSTISSIDAQKMYIFKSIGGRWRGVKGGI